MWLVPFQGYKRNVFLIVEKVCDGYGAVADPRAQEHEESNPGLHFTALQSTWGGGKKELKKPYVWMKAT